MIFDVLSTLSDLTEYLSEKYLKAVSSNPLYLILHNQSFEEGERLREGYFTPTDNGTQI